MLTLKRRKIWGSLIFQVEIEQKVVEMEWTEKLSARARNLRQLKTRWKANIFAAYIKNLGRTFLIRAHNLEFRPEKWKKPTWGRKAFNNLLFGFFWAGFQLDRWKNVASCLLESMAGHNKPVMYPKCWLTWLKFKLPLLQTSEIAITTNLWLVWIFLLRICFDNGSTVLWEIEQIS